MEPEGGMPPLVYHISHKSFHFRKWASKNFDHITMEVEKSLLQVKGSGSSSSQAVGDPCLHSAGRRAGIAFQHSLPLGLFGYSMEWMIPTHVSDIHSFFCWAPSLMPGSLINAFTFIPILTLHLWPCHTAIKLTSTGPFFSTWHLYKSL